MFIISPLLFCIPAAFVLMQFMSSDLYVTVCRPLATDTRQLVLIVLCCLWFCLLAGGIEALSNAASSLTATR